MHPPEISELYIQAQGHSRTLIVLGFGLFFFAFASLMLLIATELPRRTKWLRGLSAVIVIGALTACLVADDTNNQATLRHEEAKHQAASFAYYKDHYGVAFDYYDDLQRLQSGETVNAELNGKPTLVSLTGPYDDQKLIASDASEVHEVKLRR